MAITDILAESKYTMQQPIEVLLIIAKHANQSAFHKLVEKIPHVIFYTPDNSFGEKEFLALLPAKGTARKGVAVVIDDMEGEGLRNILELAVKLALRLSHHHRITCFLSLHAIYYNDWTLRLVQK